MSWRKKGGMDEVIVIVDIVDETDGRQALAEAGGVAH